LHEQNEQGYSKRHGKGWQKTQENQTIKAFHTIWILHNQRCKIATFILLACKKQKKAGWVMYIRPVSKIKPHLKANIKTIC